MQNIQSISRSTILYMKMAFHWIHLSERKRKGKCVCKEMKDKYHKGLQLEDHCGKLLRKFNPTRKLLSKLKCAGQGDQNLLYSSPPPCQWVEQEFVGTSIIIIIIYFHIFLCPCKLLYGCFCKCYFTLLWLSVCYFPCKICISKRESYDDCFIYFIWLLLFLLLLFNATKFLSSSKLHHIRQNPKLCMLTSFQPHE